MPTSRFDTALYVVYGCSPEHDLMVHERREADRQLKLEQRRARLIEDYQYDPDKIKAALMWLREDEILEDCNELIEAIRLKTATGKRDEIEIGRVFMELYDRAAEKLIIADLENYNDLP